MKCMKIILKYIKGRLAIVWGANFEDVDAIDSESGVPIAIKMEIKSCYAIGMLESNTVHCKICAIN